MERCLDISIPPLYLTLDKLPDPWPVYRQAWGRMVYVDLHTAIVKAEETLPSGCGEKEDFTNFCLCHANWTKVDGKQVELISDKFKVGDMVEFTFKIQETQLTKIYCTVSDITERSLKISESKPKSKRHKRKSTTNIDELRFEDKLERDMIGNKESCYNLSAEEDSNDEIERQELDLYKRVINSRCGTWMSKRFKPALNPNMPSYNSYLESNSINFTDFKAQSILPKRYDDSIEFYGKRLLSENCKCPPEVSAAVNTLTRLALEKPSTSQQNPRFIVVECFPSESDDPTLLILY